jgi:hypothetical protein
VVEPGDRRRSGEGREAAQKALRVVGVKANLFPLRLGQRARAVPDLGGDAYPAEVMRQRRQPEVLSRRRLEVRVPCGGGVDVYPSPGM